MRIAIADDDRSTRHLLRALIVELGHAVVIEAGSGRALIDECMAARPDVVITDNMMDDMSGLEAALAIYRAYRVPVVLLSAFCDPTLVRAAEERHILVYLVKPVSRDHLQAALQRCANYLAERREVAPDTELHELSDRPVNDPRLRTMQPRLA